LLPGDRSKQCLLAVRLLDTLNCIQREAETLKKEPIYKLFGTAVSTVAMSRQESSNIKLDRLQTNNQLHERSILIVHLSENLQDGHGIK